jgi:tRNA(Ile)-lysidine synthase
MNADRRFLRARVRAMLPSLAAVGLHPERLAAIAGRMAEAAAAVDAASTAFMSAWCTVDAQGIVRIGGDGMRSLPSDVRLRTLSRLLLAIGGGAYPPRGERLLGLDRSLSEMGRTLRLKRTLAGVVIERRREEIVLYRELGRTGLPVMRLSTGFERDWDHRFRVQVGVVEGDLALSALAGDARLFSNMTSVTPKAALRAVPAVRRGGRVVAVPTLGWYEGGAAEMVRLTPLFAGQLREPLLFPDFTSP